jgi:hypothetical protein
MDWPAAAKVPARNATLDIIKSLDLIEAFLRKVLALSIARAL